MLVLACLTAFGAIAPLSPAQNLLPTLNCVPEEPAHTYIGASSARTGIWHALRPHVGIVGLTDGNYLDDCGVSPSSAAYSGYCGQYPWTDPVTGLGWCDGIPGDADGENDIGIGGGFFPGGPWASDPDCDYGLFPHHGPVPEIDDVAYPLLGAAGAAPAFYWGADDTGLGTTGDPLADVGSGKIPSTDARDQPILGGDGLQCITDGAITPDVDPDDWLAFCVGENPTVCSVGGASLQAPSTRIGVRQICVGENPRVCVMGDDPGLNTYPDAGGNGGFVAFTATSVTHDLGIGDWIASPFGGLSNDHGGYHEACDPTDPAFNGYNPFADANGDTWPDVFCHSPIDQDGDTVPDLPTELYVTVAGEISS